jgi:hypothetical protein
LSEDEARELLYSGGQEIDLRGQDMVAWKWFIQGQPLVVKITGTAMEIPDEMLPERTARARATKGESEVLRFLDWEKVPEEVTLHTEETLEGAGY